MNAKVTSDIVTIATAGTAVALGTGNARKLRIKALAANTGAIGFGQSDVDSTNWYELAPGDELVLDDSQETNLSKMPEFDLATHFLDTATNGNKCSILYQRY